MEESQEIKTWKARKDELEQARPFLNSDYYWKRLKQINIPIESLTSEHKE